MAAKTSFRDYTFTLDGAGNGGELSVQGDYWQCIAGAHPVTLTFDSGAKVLAPQGTGGPQTYGRVATVGTPGDVITLRLGITNGVEPYDSRGTLSGVTVTAAYAIGTTANPQPAVAVGAAASAALIGASLTRRGVLLKNLSSNTSLVWVGTPGSNGNDIGYPLDPGEGAFFETTAALTAYNPGAGAVTIGVFEVAA